jgi:hypothetical protein
LHRGYENPSVATLLGVLIAAQPADEMHRFGHGKAEAIAAMFQIVLISISALSTSVGKHKKGDLVEVQDRPHNSSSDLSLGGGAAASLRVSAPKLSDGSVHAGPCLSVSGARAPQARSGCA